MIRLTRYIAIISALILTVFVLVIGKPFFVPIVYAALLAFLSLPLYQKWLAWIGNRFVAVVITLLSILVPITMAILFFSWQIADVTQDLPSIGDSLERGIAEIGERISQIPFLRDFDIDSWAQENFSTILEQPINWIRYGISESTQTLTSFVLTFIYLLFFLLYARGIKIGLWMVTEKSKTNWREILTEIRRMVHKYLRGVFIVMAILAVLNSLGLWLIGIEYPAFWGILASFLALIPYLGTMIGGALPFFYAIASTDSWWPPLLVVILFSTVQFVEGNFITPKIVGDQVSLNPLTAIMALFIGASIWGLSGVVLAIPVAAVIRIVSTHFENLRPLAFLMGPEVSDASN